MREAGSGMRDAGCGVCDNFNTMDMRKLLLLLGFMMLFAFGSVNLLCGQVEDSDVIIVVEDSYPKSFTGYFNVTDIGMLIGYPDNQRPAPFSFMTYNGVHPTEQTSVAFGLGVEFPSGSYMPLVLDTRYYFRSTNFSPFIQLYGGYALPLDDSYSNNIWYDVSYSSMPYYEDYGEYKTKGGWLLNPGFGIRSLFGDNFGIVFSVGYRLQRLYYDAGEDRQREVNFNRLAMKIGITFK